MDSKTLEFELSPRDLPKEEKFNVGFVDWYVDV
jgi:hypothetical protein